jgi:hypothetical protein
MERLCSLNQEDVNTEKDLGKDGTNVNIEQA